MARKIEALVLRNICTESDGKIKKGEVAQLTGKEMEHYVRVGAVQRPEFVPSEVAEVNQKLEGGAA